MLVGLLVVLVVGGVLASDCGSLSSCAACMSQARCVWCRDPHLNTTDRCMEPAMGETSCSQDMLVDVDSSVTVLQDKPLSPDSVENFVQISPQLVSVKLRPNKPVSVEFQVAHAKQFPVDLYILMDLSWSMRDSLKNLANLGGEIIAGIKKKTDNLAIGFGSFVEKNVAPFTSGIASFNCLTGEDEDCSPPYSYHHKASLADIAAEDFKQAVLSSPLAGNVDDPEGSLDALMQVMVCGDRIGWRENSRKIIIVATDRDFHFAMDGKLAGILEPNDGECHLNNTQGGSGYYTHGEVLDYPSISHINSVAQLNNFLIIFAVKDIYKDIYQALTERIAGSHVDILTADGANIINIVEDRYDEITTSIKIANTPTDLQLEFSSDCEERPATQCSNVDLGTPVTFSVSVTADHCPSMDEEPVTIFPLGLAENLTILVESGCECACSAEDGQERSELCNQRGTLMGCGECQCEEGWYGRRCQCRGDSDPEMARLTCQDEAGLVCSGRGECVCGVCVCQEDPRGLISGSLCQCDDWTCPRVEGEVCAGHGVCECGECHCFPGWSGDSCDCVTSTASCLSPYDGDLCSGHGDCSCGACVCGPVANTSYLYDGDFCQVNPEGGGVCQEVVDCVQCQAFPGQLEDSCADCTFILEEMEEENINTNNYDEGSPCEARNDNNCRFRYSVKLREDGKVKVVLHTRDGSREFCPNLVTPLSIGAGALVFLIGIFSIFFYKCYIEIDGRRQYAKFQRDIDTMKSGVNQNASELYKSPITRFENPMFGK